MARRRILVAVVLAMALIGAACTGDESTTGTTAGEATTSTESAASTATETSTTTIASTTSTTAATTTSEGESFDVVLAHSGLIVADEEYFVGQNGSDPEPVVAAVTAQLGEPTTDSGWGPNPVAEGEYRFVQWDNGLTLSFDDSDVPGEGPVRHFAFYVYPGFPAGIFTVMDDITVGSSAGDVISAVERYRQDVGLDQYEWVQSALAGFWVIAAGNAEFGFLCFNTGQTAQPTDNAQIVTIFSGPDCTYDGE